MLFRSTPDPNTYYASYNDCDHQFMKAYVEREVPGLVPAWLADSLEQATVQHVASHQNYTIQNLYWGA